MPANTSIPAYGTLTVTVDGEGLRAKRWDTEYTAAHYHYDVFELSNTESAASKLKAAFGFDVKGDVVSVSVPLAPGVKDIVFTRTPDKPAAGPAG